MKLEEEEIPEAQRETMGNLRKKFLKQFKEDCEMTKKGSIKKHNNLFEKALNELKILSKKIKEIEEFFFEEYKEYYRMKKRKYTPENYEKLLERIQKECDKEEKKKEI
jgi:hypothetical protein